jgi:hypothetical protein
LAIVYEGSMIDRQGIRSHLVWIAAILGISLCARTAGAQDLNVREAADPFEQQGAWTDEQFDNWVDQIVSGINERDTPERGRLDGRLTLKLDWIQVSCGITDAQKKKLQIAGRRDIKRFLDEMREMKRQFRQIKADPIQFATLQQRLAEIQTSSAADLFGETSFLSKTLHSTLTAEQNAACAKAADESREFGHRAAVEQAVQFCDLAIGLSAEQRRRLTELFVNETRKLKRNESSELSQQFMMVLQTAKLSREKLKPIFDQEQWKVMSALLKQLEEGVNAIGFGAINVGNVVEEFFGDVMVIQGVPEGPESRPGREDE